MFFKKNKQTAFRLDGVVEPPSDRPDAPRAYVEVQFQPDDDFYTRFFREILLHLGQYPTNHPWYAVVVYPDQATERIAGAMEPLLELPNLRRVYLDRLPLIDSANPKLWLIGLIIADFAQITPIVDKIKGYRTSAINEPIDWMDLLETVLVYKLPKCTREEIRKMLNFEDVELKQTRFYQDVFAEGLAEGLAEGEARGEAKGKTKGEAMLLLKQLERKFHAVPESARKRIETADAETLLSGASGCWMPTAWMKFGGIEVVVPALAGFRRMKAGLRTDWFGSFPSSYIWERKPRKL